MKKKNKKLERKEEEKKEQKTKIERKNTKQKDNGTINSNKRHKINYPQKSKASFLLFSIPNSIIDHP